jgi:hypothetical protein
MTDGSKEKFLGDPDDTAVYTGSSPCRNYNYSLFYSPASTFLPIDRGRPLSKWLQKRI